RWMGCWRWLCVDQGATRWTRDLRFAGQVLLDGGDLRVHRVGYTRADVSLEYDAGPRGHGQHRVGGPLHHRHDLVPLALQHGEHGSGVIGQAAGPSAAPRLGDRRTHLLTDTERGNGERNDHRTIPPAMPRRDPGYPTLRVDRVRQRSYHHGSASRL